MRVHKPNERVSRFIRLGAAPFIELSGLVNKKEIGSHAYLPSNSISRPTAAASMSPVGGNSIEARKVRA